MSLISDSSLLRRLNKPGDKVPVVKPTVSPDEAATEYVERTWVPPDEAMWENFAANGEPWFSWLGSALLHGAFLLVILTGAIWIFRNDRQDVRELEPVTVPGNPDDKLGGGGGDPKGQTPDAPGRPTTPDAPQPVGVENNKLPESLPKVESTVRPNTGPTIEVAPEIVIRIPAGAPKIL